MHARRMLVSGRVQGVAFRAHTEIKARALGVVGCVRNLADGRVEIFAQAEDDKLDALVAWCHEGPSLARVDRVVVEVRSVDPALSGFAVAATAGRPDE